MLYLYIIYWISYYTYSSWYLNTFLLYTNNNIYYVNWLNSSITVTELFYFETLTLINNSIMNLKKEEEEKKKEILIIKVKWISWYVKYHYQIINSLYCTN